MLNPTKYNIHKFFFIVSANFFILFIALKWLEGSNNVKIIVLYGILPTALLMFALGLLTMLTRPRNPRDARRSASDKANNLLQQLATSTVGHHLTKPSKRVIRLAELIEDPNHPELHKYEASLDEMYELVPACLLPRNYGETDRPLLDWHKYDLCIIAADEDEESAITIKNTLLHRIKGLRIYVNVVNKEQYGERQELFIRRVFYASSLKCLALISIHMINDARSKEELNYAMQRELQVDNDICRNYLIPIAMDKHGLEHMEKDEYLSKYAQNLKVIQNYRERFDVITNNLSRILKQSIYYDPPVVPYPKKTDKRFAIALSFPGEHRPTVNDVAKQLETRLNGEKVFYDANYEHELARPNLDTNLQAIYRDQAELVVVFICAEYAVNEWCGVEWKVVRELLKQKNSDKIIMYISLDGTNNPLSDIDGYVNAAHRSPEEIAKLIMQRLDWMRQSR